jgi:hypothetical protein
MWLFEVGRLSWCSFDLLVKEEEVCASGVAVVMLNATS